MNNTNEWEKKFDEMYANFKNKQTPKLDQEEYFEKIAQSTPSKNGEWCRACGAWDYYGMPRHFCQGYRITC